MIFKFYKIIRHEDGVEIARFKSLERACNFMIHHTKSDPAIEKGEISMIVSIHQLAPPSIRVMYPDHIFND